MKKLVMYVLVIVALSGVIIQPSRAQLCNDPNNPTYRITWEIEEGLKGEVGSEFIFKDPDAKNLKNVGGVALSARPYGVWPSWARLTGPNNVDPNIIDPNKTWLCDDGYNRPAEANYVSYWLMIDTSKATQGTYNFPVEANDGDPNGLAYFGERANVVHTNHPPTLAAVGAKR